jgi:hypothetical protein
VSAAIAASMYRSFSGLEDTVPSVVSYFFRFE